MRLTDEMKWEFDMIVERMDESYDKSLFAKNFCPRLDSINYTGYVNQLKQKFLNVAEVESFKVKLENFYSETDLKEGLKSRLTLSLTT